MLIQDENNGNRTVDEFGYMTVENCVLTGEDVAKYFGYEIPYFEKLGLQKDKVYFVYRPIEEIKDANFSNKPLLSDHADFSAEDYKHKLIVGTVGETRMENNQNMGTVVFWDEKAIKMLEKGKKYLSCGYIYDPILETGFYNNSKYDIKMTNIVANHVAMVDNPRYKPAIVADEKPNSKGEKMAKAKKAVTLDSKDEEWSFEDAMDEMKSCMDSEMSPEEKAKKFEELKCQIKDKLMPRGAEDKKDELSRKEAKEEGAMDKKDEELENVNQKKNEKEEGLESAGKDKKMTGDADLIQKMVKEIVSRELNEHKKKSMAFDSALNEYERVCGRGVNRMAFDNADKVLNTILKNNRVNFDGKSFEQKQAMVEMLPTLKSQSAAPMITIDSDSVSKSHTPKHILKFLNERV